MNKLLLDLEKRRFLAYYMIRYTYRGYRGITPLNKIYRKNNTHSFHVVSFNNLLKKDLILANKLFPYVIKAWKTEKEAILEYYEFLSTTLTTYNLDKLNEYYELLDTICYSKD